MMTSIPFTCYTVRLNIQLISKCIILVRQTFLLSLYFVSLKRHYYISNISFYVHFPNSNFEMHLPLTHTHTFSLIILVYSSIGFVTTILEYPKIRKDGRRGKNGILTTRNIVEICEGGFEGGIFWSEMEVEASIQYYLFHRDRRPGLSLRLTIENVLSLLL